MLINTRNIDSSITWITLLLLFIYLSVGPVRSGLISSGSALIALVALFFGWRGLKDSSREIRIVLAGFLLYVIAALPGLVNNSDWHGAGWRFESYTPFLLAIPIWGLINRSTAKFLPVLLGGLIAAGFILHGFTLFRFWYLDIPRIGYLSGLNPNIFGFIAGLVSVSLYAALTSLKLSTLVRLVVFMALIGAVHTILATGSRGVLIAFVFSVIIMTVFIITNNTLPKKHKYIAPVLMALTIIIIIIGSLYSDFWTRHWEKLFEDILAVGSEENYQFTSISARVLMYQGAWQIWIENFWFGTGLGDAQNDYDQLNNIGKLVVAEHRELIERTSNHIFHNIFADSFATTGIIGGVTMIITVLWLPVRYFLFALRQGADKPVIRFAALSGIGIGCSNFVFGLGNSWLYLNNLPYTLILMISLMALVHNALKPDSKPV